jgi:hypothetical protein
MYDANSNLNSPHVKEITNSLCCLPAALLAPTTLARTAPLALHAALDGPPPAPARPLHLLASSSLVSVIAYISWLK